MKTDYAIYNSSSKQRPKWTHSRKAMKTPPFEMDARENAPSQVDSQPKGLSDVRQFEVCLYRGEEKNHDETSFRPFWSALSSLQLCALRAEPA